MVAISPENPEATGKLIKSLGLNFEILFDQDNAYAKQMDLVHGLPEELQEIYGGFGIDVGSSNGNGTWELPLPTRLVLGANHEIKSIELDADYTKRPEPTDTLAVLG